MSGKRNVITRRQVEDAAALRRGYEKRRFVREGGILVELLGSHRRARTHYGMFKVSYQGELLLTVRQWKKGKRAWGAPYTIAFASIDCAAEVSGWEVALLEAERDLRRKAAAEQVATHTRGEHS